MVCQSFIAPSLGAAGQPTFSRLEGESITFQCRVRGSPAPDITWSKDGGLIIPSGTKFQVTSGSFLDREGISNLVSSLVVSQLSTRDTGSYNCRASGNVSIVSLSTPYVLTVTPTTVDYCSPNPCQNGGRCTSGLTSFECECTEDYTGITCDTGITLKITSTIICQIFCSLK